jgi:hypothetical protein
LSHARIRAAWLTTTVIIFRQLRHLNFLDDFVQGFVKIMQEFSSLSRQ